MNKMLKNGKQHRANALLLFATILLIVFAAGAFPSQSYATTCVEREPNDEFATATAVPLGDTCYGSLVKCGYNTSMFPSTDASDYYRVNVPKEGQYVFRFVNDEYYTDNTTRSSYYIQVYNQYYESIERVLYSMRNTRPNEMVLSLEKGPVYIRVYGDPDYSTRFETPRPYHLSLQHAAGWDRADDGSWFYYNASGQSAVGWQRIAGTWYYFNASGVMTTGWQKVSGKWYYLNSSGAMQTGWAKVGGGWYYLAPANGSMLTGWQKIGGSWYHLRGSGVMQTGWLQSGGKWYYLYSNGKMASGCWVGNYYLTSNGVMATNAWIGRYHVGANGKWDKTA